VKPRLGTDCVRSRMCSDLLDTKTVMTLRMLRCGGSTNQNVLTGERGQSAGCSWDLFPHDVPLEQPPRRQGGGGAIFSDLHSYSCYITSINRTCIHAVQIFLFNLRVDRPLWLPPALRTTLPASKAVRPSAVLSHRLHGLGELLIILIGEAVVGGGGEHLAARQPVVSLRREEVRLWGNGPHTQRRRSAVNA
jgi:hypothetical protein